MAAVLKIRKEIAPCEPVRYVRIAKFEQVSGWTEKAVRMKIEEGVWIEGREYRRAPDGNIVIDIEGYYRWVEKGRA